MDEHHSPTDETRDVARRAELDVAAELAAVELIRDEQVESASDLTLHPPELGYYEAALRSLRDALRDGEGHHH